MIARLRGQPEDDLVEQRAMARRSRPQLIGQGFLVIERYRRSHRSGNVTRDTTTDPGRANHGCGQCDVAPRIAGCRPLRALERFETEPAQPGAVLAVAG